MSNKMQLYTVYFIRKLLYIFWLVTPPIIRILNSSMIVTGSNNWWPVPDAVDTGICAPDDGWSNHPKHVQQFTDKKTVYSCILLDIYWHRIAMHGPMNIKFPNSINHLAFIMEKDFLVRQ